MKDALPNLEHFSPEVKENIRQVFTKGYDTSYKQSLLRFLVDHPEEVEDAFGKKLSFGTGGIRSLVGVGTNRLNEYTIEITTQGLANYLARENPQKKLSVFISYDSREHSFFFAKTTARVLAANKIDVYIVKNLRPTPFCSFGCLLYRCSAAVMITASHNGPEYNGYKVYWSHGGQVLSPHDEGILEETKKIVGPEEVKITGIESAKIHWVTEDLDQKYFAKAFDLFAKFFEKKRKPSKLRIVYSNLHGTGITSIPPILQGLGFPTIFYVQEQLATDPTFPNAKNPNPEELATLEKGVDLLVEKKADLFLASDPDADRVSVVAMHEGSPIRFSGNQIACICLDFILHNKKALPENGAFIKSIVTTELFSAMCKAHGYPCYDVLTGFKYIAEKIVKWEKTKECSFIFGAEESLGYLLGSFVRDKDAALASGLIALTADHAKKQNLSLYSLLKKIYASYGVYRERLFSVTFPMEKIKIMTSIIENLRKHPKSSFGTFQTKRVEDYQKSICLDGETDLKTPLFLPKANVLRYTFQENASFVLRMSGTEPKIKCYFQTSRNEFSSVDSAIKEADDELEYLENLLKEVLSL